MKDLNWRLGGDIVPIGLADGSVLRAAVESWRPESKSRRINTLVILSRIWRVLRQIESKIGGCFSLIVPGTLTQAANPAPASSAHPAFPARWTE
jgi:hypothetical protein